MAEGPENSLINGRKIRILHISDIHAGLRDFSFSYLFDKRIFGRATQYFLRGHNIDRAVVDKLVSRLPELAPDYVICTGDLTSIGSPAEFVNAISWLQPVIDYVGSDHFFYVPGNHDAYVPLPEYGDALKRAVYDLNGGRFDFTDLPVRLELDGFDLVLAGGARPCPIWLSTGDWFSNGWSDLERCLATRRTGLPLLLATHFPFLKGQGKTLSWRAHLNNWKKLLGWAKEGRFDAQLSGHVHYPFVYKVEPRGTQMIGAGSLTICKSFMMVEIDRESGRIESKIYNIDINRQN